MFEYVLMFFVCSADGDCRRVEVETFASYERCIAATEEKSEFRLPWDRLTRIEAYRRDHPDREVRGQGCARVRAIACHPAELDCPGRRAGKAGQ